jgi:hypothetical protein
MIDGIVTMLGFRVMARISGSRKKE